MPSALTGVLELPYIYMAVPLLIVLVAMATHRRDSKCSNTKEVPEESKVYIL